MAPASPGKVVEVVVIPGKVVEIAVITGKVVATVGVLPGKLVATVSESLSRTVLAPAIRQVVVSTNGLQIRKVTRGQIISSSFQLSTLCKLKRNYVIISIHVFFFFFKYPSFNSSSLMP